MIMMFSADSAYVPDVAAVDPREAIPWRATYDERGSPSIHQRLFVSR